MYNSPAGRSSSEAEAAIHTFYLIRHGETTVFKKGIVAGATDVPLSRAGLLQMQAVASLLADKALSIVYSSPLRRTAEPAAELAAARKVPHSEVMDLAEIDFGDWEGRSYEELAKADPETFAKSKSGSPLFTFPNGENVEFFRRRVQVAFAQIVRISSGPAAIFAHGGSLRMILAAVQGLTPAQAQRIDLSPGGVSIVEPSGSGFKVAALNIVSHLPAPAAEGAAPMADASDPAQETA